MMDAERIDVMPSVPDGCRRLVIGEMIQPGDRVWIPRLGWRSCDGSDDGTVVMKDDWRWLFVRSSPDAGRGEGEKGGA